MLIVNAEPEGYSPAARAILCELGNVLDGPFDRHSLIRAVGAADVLIVRLGHHVDRTLLEAAPQLRAIVTATTGLDHIDEAAATERGVAVISLRNETAFLDGVSATAEHTWALLLALSRRLPAAAAACRRGEWDRDRFRGHELNGKRLGLLGLGRLGRKVARYGLAVGMHVAAHDPGASRWVDAVERVGSIQSLFQQSDVVSVHVPLNAATRGLVSEALINSLPAGALIVNTSRGEIIDEPALIAALRSGRIGGAALDVIAGEVGRHLANSPILRCAASCDNLIVTPHIGGATYESMEATEIFTARKLAAFLKNAGAGRLVVGA
jgi:D-3-phosphoglycerate dehydrogenase